MRRALTISIFIIIITLIFTLPYQVKGEEIVGYPMSPGKGKFLFRGRFSMQTAQMCYSDIVFSALRGQSPYDTSYNTMVELPNGWRYKTIHISGALNYGINEGITIGIYTKLSLLDIEKQVWSEAQNQPVWNTIEDKGLSSVWLFAQCRIISTPPALKNGLYIAVGVKPDINTDDQVIHGIATGTNDAKIVALSHIDPTKNISLDGDVWYQYTSPIREIEGYTMSNYNPGDKIGYRIVIARKIFKNKLLAVGGFTGWMSTPIKNTNGTTMGDTNYYSHSVLLRLKYQPFIPKNKISVAGGVLIPYYVKTPFAPRFSINILSFI